MARNLRRVPAEEYKEQSYRCFCCFDSGLITRPDALIDDYDYSTDIALVCNRDGCGAADEKFRPRGAATEGIPWDTRERLNNSATPAECEELHRLELQGFRSLTQSTVGQVQQLVRSATAAIG